MQRGQRRGFLGHGRSHEELFWKKVLHLLPETTSSCSILSSWNRGDKLCNVQAVSTNFCLSDDVYSVVKPTRMLSIHRELPGPLVSSWGPPQAAVVNPPCSSKHKAWAMTFIHSDLDLDLTYGVLRPVSATQSSGASPGLSKRDQTGHWGSQTEKPKGRSPPPSRRGCPGEWRPVGGSLE